MEDRELSEYDDYLGEKENTSGLLSPFTFLCFLLILVLLGLLFLYSSSYDEALRMGEKHYSFFVKEVIGLGAGIFIGVILSLLPKKIFDKLPLLLCPISIFFSIFSLIKKDIFSEESRYFFGLLSIVSIIFFLSFILPRIQKEERMGIPMLISSIILSLIIIPSSLSFGMGYFLLSIFIIFFTLLLSEGRVGYTIFFLFCLLGAFVLTLLLSKSSFLSFTSSSMRVNNSSFYSQNLYNSQVAIKSGGFLGKGIGNGEYKLGVIENPKGELIFSTFVEEMGAIGILLLFISLFVIFVIGLRTYKRAKERGNISSSYLSLGISMMFFFSSLINITYALGLNPFSGVPLLFFSYSPLSETLGVALAIILYKNIYINGRLHEK